ncbi:MAG: BON domain-containing protein [Methyloceanibacter sp.]
MTDSSLQQAVLDELNWQPSVKAANIGVTAKDGVVTLTGHVGSYAEKWAAERAAGSVFGVKAVAEELEVRYPFERKEDDADIAQRALQVLSWDTEVPKDKVKVKVEKGLVTLSGNLDWHYQRSAAESDVRKLHGVIGLNNQIVIKPRVQASNVRDKIKAALKRKAQIEADHITVTTDGSKVTLGGNVDTWYERSLAERTAWSAPGVTQVENRLTVG